MKGFLLKNKLLIFFIIISVLYLSALNNYLGIFGDDGINILLADSISEGKGYSKIYEPEEPPYVKYPFMFPLFLSPIVYFFGYNFLVLKTIPCIVAIISIYVLYRLFSLTDKKWATIMLFLSAINPLIFMFSHNIMSESLYMLMSLLALYFLYIYSKTKNVFNLNLFFASLFIASAYLTRTIGLSLLIAATILFLIKLFFGKDKKVILTKIGSLIVLFLLFTSFWFIRNLQVEQKDTYVRDLINKEQLVNENYDISSGSILYKFGLRFISNLYFYSGGVVVSDLKKAVLVDIAKYTVLISFIGILLWLIIISVILLRIYTEKNVVDIYVLIYIGIVFLWPHGTLRFLMPVIPFLVYYFLLFFNSLLNTYFKKYSKKIFSSMVIFVVLISLGGFSYEFYSQHKTNFYNEEWDSYYKVSKWLGNVDDGIVIARKCAPTFIWSGKKCLYPFTRNESLIKEFIKDNKIRYVIIDDFKWDNKRGVFDFIKKSEDFQLIYSEKRAELYEIKGDG